MEYQKVLQSTKKYYKVPKSTQEYPKVHQSPKKYFKVPISDLLVHMGLVQLVPVRVNPNDLSLILIQGVVLPLGLVKMGVDHKWKELKTTLKNIENPHALG